MYKFFKRAFDLILSLLLFIAISPLFLILFLMVLLKMGRPVFFIQERTTKDMKVFKLLKFRTMNNKKDTNGNLLPDEKRLTKFGMWFRASSLDELPELINIIIGDMSIIGPRPFPTKYNEFYRDNEKSRFFVRGGLIPPEILYRDVEPTWDAQLSYEAEYGKSVCFKIDFLIFVKTIAGLFKRYNNNYGEYVRNSLDSERKKV